MNNKEIFKPNNITPNISKQDKSLNFNIVLTYLVFNLITYTELKLIHFLDLMKAQGSTLSCVIGFFLVRGIYSLMLGLFIIYISKLKEKQTKNNILVILVMWIQPIIMVLIPCIYFKTPIKLRNIIVYNMDFIYMLGFILLGTNLARLLKRRK